MSDIDDTDIRILRAMQADGTKTVTEISEHVGISQSPCSRRINNLQDLGIIRGKNIDLDRRKLGFNALVVARVKLDKHDRDSVKAFNRGIRNIPEIQYAVLLLGGFDYHLHIVVRDIDHYQALIQDQLMILPGIQELESSVILNVVKKTHALPI